MDWHRFDAIPAPDPDLDRHQNGNSEPDPDTGESANSSNVNRYNFNVATCIEQYDSRSLCTIEYHNFHKSKDGHISNIPYA